MGEEIRAPKALELNAADVGEYCKIFTGVDEYGEPKGVLAYSLYDNDAPEGDNWKELTYFARGAVLGMSVDRLTGFYTLDVKFENCEAEALKTFWARLQLFKHKQEAEPDKLWMFAITVLENFDPDGDGPFWTMRIANPLAFYLIRSVPNEEALNEFPNGDGTLCGGNTVRLLISRELVAFSLEGEDEDPEEVEELSDYDLVRKLQREPLPGEDEDEEDDGGWIE